MRELETRLCCCRSMQTFMRNNKLTECYRFSELADNKTLERVTLKYGLQANALIMNQPDFSSRRRKRRSGPLKMSPAVFFLQSAPEKLSDCLFRCASRGFKFGNAAIRAPKRCTMGASFNQRILDKNSENPGAFVISRCLQLNTHRWNTTVCSRVTARYFAVQ